MTVRPNIVSKTSNSSTSYQDVPADESLENLSPPKKRLRLSLKGQQVLGLKNHSNKQGKRLSI